MRFILNFIFFGLLFYLIYLFFPEAFNTLVSWVNQIYEFFRDLFLNVSKKVQRGDNAYSNPVQTFLRTWIELL